MKPVLSFTCSDAVTSLLCNAAFPPCNYSDETNTIELFFPCTPICEDINSLCFHDFECYIQPPIDCQLIGVQTQEQPLPHWSTNVRINPNCTSVLPKSEPNNSHIACPPPLQKVSNAGNGAPCAPPCLNFTWTMREWLTVARVEFSFGLISIVLQFFLILHYLAKPRCRKSTKRFQLYSFIAHFFFSLGFTMGGPDPIKSVWCDDPTTAATFHRPRCGSQAFVVVFFGISSSFWWAISSFIMYKQLRNHKLHVSIGQELFYHLIGFGLPAIPFIIGTQLGVVKFSVLNPYCFVQNKIGVTPEYYEYILVYIPFSVSMFVAIGFIIATMSKIMKHTAHMKKFFPMHQNLGALSHVNIRLIVWCSVLFLYFANVLIYHIAMDKRAKALQTESETWKICRVRAELGVGPDTDCPGPNFPRPISLPLSVMHYVITPSIGTFTFLVFGTSISVYHFWFLATWLVYKREWARLRGLFTDEKAFSREVREYWGAKRKESMVDLNPTLPKFSNVKK
eukprot:Phypoly_transcript_05957.p1 GENE.Phypoly_transcript_05957~~Phypoly_transcript_05957.p1  ORF type:complete len:508 (+),score=28.38 Phypoly_transcript_05957:339-1862(+)